MELKAELQPGDLLIARNGVVQVVRKIVTRESCIEGYVALNVQATGVEDLCCYVPKFKNTLPSGATVSVTGGKTITWTQTFGEYTESVTAEHASVELPAPAAYVSYPFLSDVLAECKRVVHLNSSSRYANNLYGSGHVQLTNGQQLILVQSTSFPDIVFGLPFAKLAPIVGGEMYVAATDEYVWVRSAKGVVMSKNLGKGPDPLPMLSPPRRVELRIPNMKAFKEAFRGLAKDAPMSNGLSTCIDGRFSYRLPLEGDGTVCLQAQYAKHLAAFDTIWMSDEMTSPVRAQREDVQILGTLRVTYIASQLRVS